MTDEQVTWSPPRGSSLGLVTGQGFTGKVPSSPRHAPLAFSFSSGSPAPTWPRPEGCDASPRSWAQAPETAGLAVRLTCPRAPGWDQSPLLWGLPPASSPGRPQALPFSPRVGCPWSPEPPSLHRLSEGLMLYAQPGAVRVGTLEAVLASQGVVRVGVGFPSLPRSPSPSLCLRGLCSPRNVWLSGV